MIIGNTAEFAIESRITRAYERLSLRALGFFVIYVRGNCYGRRSSESSMLACSYDEIERRITGRGKHSLAFAAKAPAGKIANAFRNALYADDPQASYFGIHVLQFSASIRSNHIMWAPDGDQAFDDGSFVLHFDVHDQVRLIAFKSTTGYEYDPGTLSEVWLPADRFYRILQEWHDTFQIEWANTPKTPE